MRKLSLYVVETTNDGAKTLFNTVTRRHLPIDATEDQLKANHFLSGDEKNAIFAHLTRPTQRAAFTIVNTWECNLRCTHCTVTHKLLKKDPLELNVEKTSAFLRRFKQHYNLPHIMLTFLGGEPLLRPQSISDCMDVLGTKEFMYGITTNLTTTFDKLTMSVLDRLNHIGVSVDGTEAIHNEQRRSLTLATDPFQTTINNLKSLVIAGYRDKVSVQGAINDKYLTNGHKREFYRMLLKLGIKFEKIRFACLHPTTKNPQMSSVFANSLKNDSLRGQVCCKYRYYNFVIDRDGTIFADYYTWEKIGSIDDDIETIDRAAKQLIGRMPVLQDEKCKTCSAIGYCWGGCTNGEVAVGDTPSKYCDQEGLIKNITLRAQSGSLK